MFVSQEVPGSKELRAPGVRVVAQISVSAGMLICMRTTLNLNDELMRKAKKAAAESGVTLTSFIEDAVREALVPQPAKPYKLHWRTHDGTLAVDPADRDALYEFLERQS